MQNQYEHRLTGNRGFLVKLNHIWRILTNKNYFLISFELDPGKNVKGITMRTYNADENAVKDISRYVYETIHKSQSVANEAKDILGSAVVLGKKVIEIVRPSGVILYVCKEPDHEILHTVETKQLATDFTNFADIVNLLEYTKSKFPKSTVEIKDI